MPRLRIAGSGVKTVAANPITITELLVEGATLQCNAAINAQTLTITAPGRFNAGAGRTHAVSAINGTGTLNMGTSTIHAGGSTVDLGGLDTVIAGSGTFALTGSVPQTFIPPRTSLLHAVTVNTSSTVTLSTQALQTGALTITGGRLNLGSGLTHSCATVLLAPGTTLDWGTATLQVNGATADLRHAAALVPGNGVLAFTGTAPQTFIPHEGTVFSKIVQNGTATTTIVVNNLAVDILHIAQGTFGLGSALTHTIGMITGAGALNAGSSTLRMERDTIDLSSLGTIISGTATLRLCASEGDTQVVVAHPSQRYPRLLPADGTIVRLSGTTFLTTGVLITNGGLDFNGCDLNCSGNLTVQNGTGSVFSGLGGRTITVGGDAQLQGSPGNLLNLNPVDPYTITVSNLLSAELAVIANSTAGGSAGSAVASTNGGGNVNWEFEGKIWSGLGGDNHWSTAENWTGGELPTEFEPVIFGSLSTKDCMIDTDVTVRRIQFNSGYTGTLSFGAHTFTVTGTADFRTGGSIVSDPAARLVLGGTSSQNLYHAAAGTLPALVIDNPAGVVVRGDSLRGSNLELIQGTMSLDEEVFVSVNDISGVTPLVLGRGSVLEARGATIDLSQLPAISAATAQFRLHVPDTQHVIPPSGITLPRLIKRGSGHAVIAPVALTCPFLQLEEGTLSLAAPLTVDTLLIGNGSILNMEARHSHSIGTLATLSSGGHLSLGECTLRITESIHLEAGTTSHGADARIVLVGTTDQSITVNPADTLPGIICSTAAGATIHGSLITAGRLDVQSGTLVLAPDAVVWAEAVTGTGGIRLSPGCTLNVYRADAELAALTAFDDDGGLLRFTGNTQTFRAHAGHTYPALVIDNDGGLTIIADSVTTGSVTIERGGLNLATGSLRMHSLTARAPVGFSGSRLSIDTDADFIDCPTVNAGAGDTLLFAAPSGVQILHSHRGITLPVLNHSGTSQLRFDGDGITARGLVQSAGTLDFNTRTVAIAENGDLAITNGTASTIANLAGCTLTVSGSARLSGQSGNLLNLNPPGRWYFGVGESLVARFARVGWSDAGAGVRGLPDSTCVNARNNVNWAFNLPPAVGYVIDHVLPQAQIRQSGDGSGTVTVSFKIRDDDRDSGIVLHDFEYSVNNGNTWSAPGDNSGGFSNDWADNNYRSDTSFAVAPVQQFTFNALHPDFTALHNIDLSTVRIRFRAADHSATSTSQVVSGSFRIDTRSPFFTGGYPQILTVADTGITLSIESNEHGRVFGIVYPAPADTPSARQIRLGNDAANVPVADGLIIDRPVVAGTAQSFEVRGLNDGTVYTIALTLIDTMGNLNPQVSLLQAMTIDVSPPQYVHNYPRLDTVGATHVTALAAINESGRIYGILTPHGTLPPTSEQVRNGIDGNGTPVKAAWRLDTLIAAHSIVTAEFAGLDGETGYAVWITAQDSSGNLMASPAGLTFTTGDNTPPQFVQDYPRIDSIGATSIRLMAQINEDGRLFGVVLDGGSPAPTAAQVRSGLRHDGTPVDPGRVIDTAVTAATPLGLIIGGLEEFTAYDIRLTARDAAGNAMPAAVLLAVTTRDTTPPQFLPGYPQVVEVGGSSATIACRINEPGAVYALALPAQSPAPSADQIRSGRTANGDPIPDCHNRLLHLEADSTGVVIFNNLLHQTLWDIWVVAQDSSGNLQRQPVVLSIATVDTIQPFVTQISGVEPEGTYAAGDTLTLSVAFSEPVVPASDTVRIVIVLGEIERELTLAPGPGDHTLRAYYLVGAGDYADTLRNGTVLINAAGIVDHAGNPALSTIGSGAGIENRQRYHIDGIAPLVTLTVGDTLEEPQITVSSSKELSALTLVLTRTAGEPDPASPHVVTIENGTPLPREQSVRLTAPGVKPVRNARYTLTLAARDMAGNQAVPQVSPEFRYVPATVSIGVEPRTARVSADSVLYFAAMAIDNDGNRFPIQTAWALTDTTLGSIDRQGLFTPRIVGTIRVAASATHLSDTSGPITIVAGAIARISIDPDSLELDLDTSVRLKAAGFDRYGNRVIPDSNALVWSATLDTEIPAFELDPQGLLTPLWPGTGRIGVVYNGIYAANGSVTIRGWQRALNPDGDQTIEAGKGLTLYLPPMDLRGRSVMTLLPVCPDTTRNSGLVFFGTPISFDCDSRRFPRAVTLEMRYDSAVVRDRGFDPVQVRLYALCDGDSLWRLMDDAQVHKNALQIQSASLCSVYAPAIDTVPPTLTFSQPEKPAVPGTPVVIRAKVSDNIANPQVRLYYRLGGERTETGLAPQTVPVSGMPKSSLSTSTEEILFTLSDSLVTTAGISFRIEAGDGTNRNGSVQTNIPITALAVAAPQPIAAGYYQMYSIPGGARQQTVLQMLRTSLGPFDNTRWRLYTVESDAFREITVDIQGAVIPGRAFWLRTAQPVALLVDTLPITDVSAPCEVELAPGWNTLSNPYTFPLDWEEVLRHNEEIAQDVMGVYAWDPQNKLWIDPARTRIIEPWKGYLVRNMRSEPLTLAYPPYRNRISPARQRHVPTATAITIATHNEHNEICDRIIARFNVHGAQEHYDQHDYLHPLTVPGSRQGPTLYFSRDTWGLYKGSYMVDARGELDRGALWQFSVLHPEKGERIRVSFSGLAALPDSVEAVLLDYQRNTALHLTDSAFTYASEDDAPRRFALLIGSPGFIAEQTRHFRQLPRVWALYQNFPNPFRSVTAINFQVPVTGHDLDAERIPVKLTILDAKGRTVADLVDRRLEPGTYSVQWNGRSNRQGRPASGIYLYRLSAGRAFQKTRTMILLQ